MYTVCFRPTSFIEIDIFFNCFTSSKVIMSETQWVTLPKVKEKEDVSEENGQ